MKLITRDTDYAIRAISCIAGSGKKTLSARDLTRNLGVPKPFMRKILQELNKKGVLKSCKGKGGGFSLGKSPDRITVFDMIEIFQGRFELNEHVFKGSSCPYMKICLLKKELDSAEKDLVEKLKALTIAVLLKDGKSIWEGN